LGDLVYAQRNVRFAMTKVTIGIMPSCGGTTNLSLIRGERRAKESILIGRALSAEEVPACGMMNRVCDDGEAVFVALDTARAMMNESGRIPVAAQFNSTRVSGRVDCAAAFDVGITLYKRSQDGLGGCPIARGPCGNSVSVLEKLLFMLDAVCCSFGIDLRGIDRSACWADGCDEELRRNGSCRPALGLPVGPGHCGTDGRARALIGISIGGACRGAT
jgi:hypothetical protein